MKNSINNSFLKKYQVPIIIGCCLLALIISVAANKIISYKNNNYYNERQLGDATNPLTSISCGSVTVKVNSSVSVIVTAVYEDGTTKNVTSSASISGGGGYVSFPAAGYVKGVKEGSSTINVSYTENGVTKSTTVAVTVEADETEEPTKQVESITIISSGGSLEIEKGKTTSLTVRAYYSDNTNELISSSSVSWTTSHSSIANVNGSGVVTGVDLGSTSIIATYGGKSASLTVKVVAPSLSSISLNDPGKTIKVGETLEFKVTAKYSSGTTTTVGNTAVTWNSSDSSVVTITDGVATGVGMGTATITANYQGKAATYEITVETNASSISISPGKIYLAKAPDSENANVTVKDSSGKAIQAELAISGYDSNIITVTSNGYNSSYGYYSFKNESNSVGETSTTVKVCVKDTNVCGNYTLYMSCNPWTTVNSTREWGLNKTKYQAHITPDDEGCYYVDYNNDCTLVEGTTDKYTCTKYYNRCCGTGSGGNTPSTPSTPTYSCYKNSTGTEFSWAISAPESGWTVVSGKTENTCKACFVNSSTNDYKWAVKSPGEGYVVSTTITTEGACVAPSTPVTPPEPTYACYVNSSTNDYKWATSSPGAGYVVSTTITTEGACVKPTTPQPTYACYKNDNNDYKWATSAPDGYTLVSDITNENDCKYVVEVPSTAATVASIVYVAVIVMIIVGGSLVYIYKDKILKLQ